MSKNYVPVDQCMSKIYYLEIDESLKQAKPSIEHFPKLLQVRTDR